MLTKIHKVPPLDYRPARKGKKIWQVQAESTRPTSGNGGVMIYCHMHDIASCSSQIGASRHCKLDCASTCRQTSAARSRSTGCCCCPCQFTGAVFRPAACCCGRNHYRGLCYAVDCGGNMSPVRICSRGLNGRLRQQFQLLVVQSHDSNPKILHTVAP